MIKTGIKEMRKNFSEYINRVQKGEEVIITKRDEPVAKLVPVEKKIPRTLKTHKELRKAIKPMGKPLSEVILESREERF
ncbi:MAG: type II toxin-antitoxin system prevent-host-death family antitoxin [Desulfobacterales bacterium]|jgi:prevent-host-death family protein|nr:type II toxin-antitoxin system prevent-host-death family antitoxin [Desulfobacterales bacterium]